MLEASDKSKNFFEDINGSSFAFKPVAESGSTFFLGARSKVTTFGFYHYYFLFCILNFEKINF